MHCVSIKRTSKSGVSRPRPSSKFALEWPSGLDVDVQGLESGDLQEYSDFLTYLPKHQALFQSANGLLGFGPSDTKVGDDICILIGYGAPFMLRKVESHYILLGECTVSGLMDSQYLEGMLESP